jgi:hypothetical protein
MALRFPAPAQIQNLLDPTNNTDAATKQYVDGQVSGSAATLNSAVDEFTGDGTRVAFTLSSTPSNKNFTFAVVQGIMQPKSSYSVSGAILTFSSAPPNGSLVEVTTLGLS